MLALLALSGCSLTVQPDWRTADDVVAMLKGAGLPIGLTISYTAESDPDRLLGTPGGYTSRVDFQDTRLPILGSDRPDLQSGGSVEFFPNRADMWRRAEAIRKRYESGTIPIEYQHRFYNVLLRLTFALTPEQRADYDRVLSEYSRALKGR